MEFVADGRIDIEPIEQIMLFDFQEKDKKSLCIIKDWRAKRVYTFQDLVNKRSN